MIIKEVPTYFAVFTCYIAILGHAFILGFASPTQKQLLEKKILNKDTLPLFASMSNFGLFLGTVMMFLCVQSKINSNGVVIMSSILGGVGCLMIISADSALLIIAGVTLFGVYSSCAFYFANMYVVEVSLENQRRMASGGIGFCIRIGLFFVYSLGIWLSFRWLAGVMLIFLIIFVILLSVNPKSPEWYVSQGLEDRAKATLLYLHGKDFDADSELQKIQNSIKNKQFTWIDSINALKNWKVLKSILLMAAFTCCKEFGGHEAMVSFSSYILENQQGMDPKVASLFYPIFLTVGAIVSIIVLECCKLKWQIILGVTLQCISHISMAVYYFVSENHLSCMKENLQICQTISFWPMVNIALYAFGFSLGWGLTYFSLVGTLLIYYRKVSVLIVFLLEYLCMFAVINLFYFSLTALGGLNTFLLLAIVSLIAIVVTCIFLDK